ncbi:hypothetical protein [Campylobacter concisus]|uniref:hypothetical protein n=1 Tax=Campylobacter concisus TaxID=199 RepID=UPI0005563F54|nr:hypothetical protein [Campylobacter concisus]
MKINKLLLIGVVCVGLHAESITKQQVCHMIDALSYQLNIKDLGNNEFTINYKDGALYKYDNLDEYKKWFIECYDRDRLIARIIDKGKIIERIDSSIGNYKWVTFELENCTLKTLGKGSDYAPIGEPKCKNDSDRQEIK